MKLLWQVCSSEIELKKTKDIAPSEEGIKRKSEVDARIKLEPFPEPKERTKVNLLL
jgi:hypothetical protein